jgi:hypothetical protein
MNNISIVSVALITTLSASPAHAHRARHMSSRPARTIKGGWERPLADIARAITLPKAR